MSDDLRYYLLTPPHLLRGWKLLPYAIQNSWSLQTTFFDKHEWDLMLACDGHSPIAWGDLSDEDRAWYRRLEEGGVIIPCAGDASLRPRQEYRFYPARFKKGVQWSITGRCNYRCKHCLMSSPSKGWGEPSWDQLMFMLDAFERCGINGVSLTGGEPTVRKDFWPLVDEILGRGMAVPTIYTNGLLVSDGFLDELQRRSSSTKIQFSFDGVGFHDWMRGVPGAERAVTSALSRCKERGVGTSVSMVICKESKDSIRETVNLLAELGCSSLKVNSASPQGEWKGQQDHHLTVGETFETYLAYMPDYVSDGMPLSITLDGFFSFEKGSGKPYAMFERGVPEESFGRAYTCGSIRRELYVSPKGDVLPCMAMVGEPIADRFPNLLDTPLEAILDGGSVYMDYIDVRVSDYMDHNRDCRACEYRSLCCGGCRAAAVRDTPGDYLAKDPVACEYFTGGWKARKDDLLRRVGLAT